MRRFEFQPGIRNLSRRSRRGFNYRDLLCVFALITMLAVFAIPSLLNAYTRRNVYQAKVQLRDTYVTLERYAIDNCCYPPAADQLGHMVSWQVPSSTDKYFHYSCGYLSKTLTTPFAYADSLSFDPFGPKNKPVPARTFPYAARSCSYWILISRGPDRDVDMEVKDYVLDPINGEILYFASNYYGLYVEYDPTNGTISNGDIFRTGP